MVSALSNKADERLNVKLERARFIMKPSAGIDYRDREKKIRCLSTNFFLFYSFIIHIQYPIFSPHFSNTFCPPAVLRSWDFTYQNRPTGLYVRACACQPFLFLRMRRSFAGLWIGNGASRCRQKGTRFSVATKKRDTLISIPSSWWRWSYVDWQINRRHDQNIPISAGCTFVSKFVLNLSALGSAFKYMGKKWDPCMKRLHLSFH